MSESNYINDPLEYAIKYAELSIKGLQPMESKHVTELIKELVTGKLALDVGCGPGQSTLFLKSCGLDATGVDLNPHMIEKALQRDPTGRYTVIKIADIPCDDNYFDMVYAGWSLVHAESKQELSNVCKEIARVMKRGATFIMVVNNDDTYNKEWLTVDTRFDMNAKVTSGSIVATKFKENDYVVYNYYWTEEDYLEALTDAGLDVVRLIRPQYVDGKIMYWDGVGQMLFSNVYAAQKL